MPSSANEADHDAVLDSIAPPDTRDLTELCVKTHKRLEAFLTAETKDDRIRAVQGQSRKSLKVIGEALETHDLSTLSLSYNGGKDCLVLLILYLHALHTFTLHHPTIRLPQKLNSIYIISPHPFETLSAFVTHSENHYHLSLARYDSPLRSAFSAYISSNPHIRAIFVGTRRTDPNGANLTAFDKTDRGWPDFMRVHPVIDWHYAEIWTFLRELGVEYCGLYDEGYTSLGGKLDTLRNPALKREGGEETGWRPAYELTEDGEERLGRDV